ncbi:MAG: ERCC4 domain-containing protein [Acidilobus sp.]
MSEERRRPRVYADVREESSGVPNMLEKLGVMVIRRQLPEGDYLIPDDVVVERKSASDFVSSLFDGRLFEQSSRLAEGHEEVYYLIEGDLFREIRLWPSRRRQLLGALVTLVAVYGVKLLWSPSREESAELIAALAMKTQESRAGPVVINKKPRLGSPREWQLYVLQAFPGVGAKTAERILQKFGSLEGFFNASVAELASVEGLGESKAARIKEIIKAPYVKRTGNRTTLDRFYQGEGSK